MADTTRTRWPAGPLRACAPLLVLLAVLAAAIALLPAASASAKPPNLDATSWLLVDRRDGEVLASHAPDARRSIASTTKLMTAYLALDRLRFREWIRMPAYDANPVESLAGLRTGERLTVKDLLYALLLPSANDAAEALAVGTSGSVAKFVREMNESAADLGLRSTSFANPIGLDQQGNYSTADDLARLSEELLADKRLRRIVATPEYEMRSGDQPRLITTTNDLLLEDPRVDGVKTGRTSEAGYVLIASAKRSGVSLLSIVLGAPNEGARDAESSELLDYGYSRYTRRRPVERGAEVTATEVRYEDESLPLLADRGVEVSARRDQMLDVAIDAPAQVEGPVAVGERLGSVTVRLDGRVVGRTPIRAGRAVDAPGAIDRIGGPAVALAALVALTVILLLIALVVRGRRSRDNGRRSPEERERSQQERARKRNGN